MTDYLELAVGGSANALLAAQRRADRAAAAVFYRAGGADAAVQEHLVGRVPAGETTEFPVSLTRAQAWNGDIPEGYRVPRREHFADSAADADVRMQRESRLNGDTVAWREQLERKLRRDSRRYDAGFFLY